MKSKLTLTLFFSTFILGSASQAAVVVNAPEPAAQYVATDTNFELFYAGGATGSPPSGYINSVKGFRYISTALGTIRDAANWIYIDVSTDKAFSVSGNQRLVVMLSTTANANSEIPIVAAGVRNGREAPGVCIGGSTGNCQNSASDSKFYAAKYTPASTLRLAITLQDLCDNTAARGTLCTSGTAYIGLVNNLLTQALTVTFAVVDDFQVAKIPLPVAAGTFDSDNFTLTVSDIAPTSSCTGIAEERFYFPGDEQIYLKTGDIDVGLTAAGTPGPPVANLAFIGKLGSLPSVPPAGMQETGVVVGYAGVNGAEAIIPNGANTTRFVNTTDGVNNTYQARVHAENRAGMLSDSTLSCEFTDVRSQPIRGVLTESKCFIATAAYQNGRAAPVMMLRKFRDQILANTKWGREFIETYYEHSPAWAEWAWDKPLIRSLALKLLTPLELAAWVTLKLAGAEQVTTPTTSESYIDRLRRTLPAATPTGGSYSEEQKKKIEAEAEKPASSEDYSTKELEKIKASEVENPVEPSDGYTDKQKLLLPPARHQGSPTELVKSGRDRKLGRGDVPPIKNAVSLRIGVSPGLDVSVNGSSAEYSFSNIYGAGWQPEILIHFERQLFHSENFGSLGLTVDTGLSYAEGFGLLAFDFAGSRVSQTKFSFVQMPLLFGGNYRFNFFRFVRPYVGAGIGTMLYTEIRKDDVGDKRGYSFIYDAHAGVSLLLDFLDEGTARESYLSEGIQHTYLFLEFFYLNTLGGGVRFTRSGIYSGFLFEI